MRLWTWIVLLATGCNSAASQTQSTDGLVVLVVIDQWPEWAFEAKRPYLHAGGFDRLLSEGDWHVGRHPSAVTLTAPGHALLGTGEPTARSGIVANEWWHRDAGRVLKSVEGERGEVTATWLRVPGLGDSIEGAHRGGKAVSVSLKDRAAVLPLGHAGTAIWYDPKTVDWQSTARPPWLADWNRTNPIALHLHDVWTPLDPESLRQLSRRRDYEIGEVGEKGFGATFPHALDRTKAPAEAVFATPMGNDLIFDTAVAAVDGEGLGRDDVPDLLVISLSAHDYIAHGWGHESWESWDATMRLDRRLAVFMDELDRKVGSKRWSMIVTSDHGASRLPELAGGGRQTFTQIAAVANTAAVGILGPGTWIAEAKFPTVYLSDPALADPRHEQVVARVVAALREMPGLDRVEPVASLVGHCETRQGDDRALCLGLDPERSGEVLYMPRTGWILEDDDEPLATAHGSQHDYDQQVPVVVLTPGRTTHRPMGGPGPEPVAMEDVAGMLAGWLHVVAPRDLR